MNDQDDKTKPSNYLTSIYLLFRSFSIEVSITPQMGIQRFWFTKLIAPRIHIQKFPNKSPNDKNEDTHNSEFGVRSYRIKYTQESRTKKSPKEYFLNSNPEINLG